MSWNESSLSLLYDSKGFHEFYLFNTVMSCSGTSKQDGNLITDLVKVLMRVHLLSIYVAGYFNQ